MTLSAYLLTIRARNLSERASLMTQLEKIYLKCATSGVWAIFSYKVIGEPVIISVVETCERHNDLSEQIYSGLDKKTRAGVTIEYDVLVPFENFAVQTMNPYKTDEWFTVRESISPIEEEWPLCNATMWGQHNMPSPTTDAPIYKLLKNEWLKETCYAYDLMYRWQFHIQMYKVVGQPKLHVFAKGMTFDQWDKHSNEESPLAGVVKELENHCLVHLHDYELPMHQKLTIR